MTPNALIEIVNVGFQYVGAEKVALKNISLSIQKGEVVAIVGHNGSGKSTLCKMLNALLLPAEGTVTVDGMDTRDENNLLEIRRRVGMVFQNPDNQLVTTIVEEDVGFGPENLGVPPAEIRARVDAALNEVEMSEYAEKAGMDPFDAYCDILIRNNGLGLGIYFHMSEDDMTQILSHPLCVLGTDGLIGKSTENPHPRAFGSTARAYDLLVRKKKLLTPEAMIHKMTGQAANFLGLSSKGRIADGADADVLLIDLDRFCDTATYQNGNALTQGIERIFISGREIALPKPE